MISGSPGFKDDYTYFADRQRLLQINFDESVLSTSLKISKESHRTTFHRFGWSH